MVRFSVMVCMRVCPLPTPSVKFSKDDQGEKTEMVTWERRSGFKGEVGKEGEGASGERRGKREEAGALESNPPALFHQWGRALLLCGEFKVTSLSLPKLFLLSLPCNRVGILRKYLGPKEHKGRGCYK